MIYLASPYTSPDPAVVEARYHAANRAAAHLMSRGLIVFAPISMSHPIAALMERGLTNPEWYAFDEAFMQHCERCVVVMMDGWRESVGVTREIAYFEDRRRPVTYMESI